MVKRGLPEIVMLPAKGPVILGKLIDHGNTWHKTSLHQGDDFPTAQEHTLMLIRTLKKARCTLTHTIYWKRPIFTKNQMGPNGTLW